MISGILKAYGLDERQCTVEPLTSGLINNTWKITARENQYIFQRINDNVFKQPHQLAENISLLNAYLKDYAPSYLFVAALPSIYNNEIYYDKDHGYFRAFPFIKGSHTINVVTSADQAFEASYQFGNFTKVLSEFNAHKLNITIQNFHNLALRYNQFENALQNGNPMRIKQSAHLISDIKKYSNILSAYEKITKNISVKQRVTHHDTKISNVLFNDQGKGICVIDLDTVMPGYFISDLGDMLRTYLSPANEEEQNFDKIEIREDFFRAVVHGYVSSMGNALTKEEQNLILYSGFFLIYMQAIRFLADYFNNDVYYGARYDEHNFVRAGNQLHLLKKLEEKSSLLEKIIAEELKTASQLFFPES